ncbi:beta-catenin-like protein 1 [Clonorchis sinensis]|uniref:Beta-catenin-like protein 1 n=1 Tax=Clonorchis sinensis TaxID=79923 RepID=G7Y3Z2_CLOSI|nr:beta-catenin-like protein 1 [Clonorchis sinensis]
MCAGCEFFERYFYFTPTEAVPSSPSPQLRRSLKPPPPPSLSERPPEDAEYKRPRFSSDMPSAVPSLTHTDVSSYVGHTEEIPRVSNLTGYDIEDEEPNQPTTVGASEVDEATVRRLTLFLEKRALANQEARTKFPDQPKRFMQSEVDLQETLEEMQLKTMNEGTKYEPIVASFLVTCEADDPISLEFMQEDNIVHAIESEAESAYGKAPLYPVVNDSVFGKIVRDLNLPIRVHGECINTKEELVSAWGDGLHNSVDGRGLRELVASPLSNRWLVFPERVFPRIFIRGIQLRCNLLRTRVRSARHGHGGQTILCCGNCGQPESLVHILQSCCITDDAKCARHNRVARKLTKRLGRLGYTVFEESVSFIRPDPIAVRERRATVIDVVIILDGRGVAVCNEKKQKYDDDDDEYSFAIISAGCDVDFLVHQPMIISYRGVCFPQSAKAIVKMGL